MKKFLFLVTTIFQATIHAMSFEKVPMPIKLQIFELVADSDQNLKQLLFAKRVSKYWHTLINNEEIQKKLKAQKVSLKLAKQKEDNTAGFQLLIDGVWFRGRKHSSGCRPNIPCACD